MVERALVEPNMSDEQLRDKVIRLEAGFHYTREELSQIREEHRMTVRTLGNLEKATEGLTQRVVSMRHRNDEEHDRLSHTADRWLGIASKLAVVGVSAFLAVKYGI